MIRSEMVIIPNEFVVMGKTKFEIDKFKPIKNRPFSKPYGGLWASPYRKNDKFVSDWHEWVYYELPEKLSEDYSIITLDNAFFYVINSYNDLLELYEVFGEYIPPEYNNLPKDLRECMARFLNFEEIAKSIDVLYLTKKGLHETCEPLGASLYGWDVESILIMNPNVISSWEHKKITG